MVLIIGHTSKHAFMDTHLFDALYLEPSISSF